MNPNLNTPAIVQVAVTMKKKLVAIKTHFISAKSKEAYHSTFERKQAILSHCLNEVRRYKETIEDCPNLDVELHNRFYIAHGDYLSFALQTMQDLDNLATYLGKPLDLQPSIKLYNDNKYIRTNPPVS